MAESGQGAVLMAVKFCPLRQGGCIQEDCAWWIRFEGCSVPQLVSVLKDIEGDIDNLTPGEDDF